MRLPKIKSRRLRRLSAANWQLRTASSKGGLIGARGILAKSMMTKIRKSNRFLSEAEIVALAKKKLSHKSGRRRRPVTLSELIDKYPADFAKLLVEKRKFHGNDATVARYGAYLLEGGPSPKRIPASRALKHKHKSKKGRR